MKKLIDQETKKNTNLIKFPILITLYIYIWLTKIFENEAPNIKFAEDGIIYEK